MQDLPTGTVTFLFTDIEGSTQLLHHLGDAYPGVLEQHATLVRDVLRAAGGVEVSTEGDAFFCVFTSPAAAVRAAVAIQRALAGHVWPDGASVRVRMGLHTGEGILGGDNYVGIDVHRAARIASAGNGGQVLVSEPTRALAAHALGEDVALRDLGEHRLKDLEHPEQLYELLVDGLEQDFPPLRTLDPVLHNLPVQLSSLLGREAEVLEVQEALARARLVTLTGPGGTGKTRLAIEAACAESGRLPDGAWFVDLTPISDPSLFASAVVDALGIRYAAGEARHHLVQHFEARRALLVLDNFEQLLPAGREVSELLKECPELRTLVTSRAALRVTGEQEVPIPPLRTPRDAADASASESPAVRLFVERAASARPDFALTEENAQAVAAITARLDGLPLAIELAAALVKLLPPRSILDRLERSLDVLTGGAQDLPDRQRSLRGAIAWSYELLDERPRRLLEHMAVFAGGASYEMIEEVCAPGDSMMLLDALRTLVDQSLVVQTEEDGEPRFSMLGAIRDFALERLEAEGDAPTVCRRHAEAFRDLAIRADRGMRGPEEARWVTVISREMDNLRAAVTWSIEVDDADLALSTIRTLDAFATYRSRNEVFAWAAAALDLSGAAEHPEFCAVAAMAAWAPMLRGDLARAIEIAERGRAAVSDPKDPACYSAMAVLGVIAIFEGRFDDARTATDEAIALAAGDRDLGLALMGSSLLETYSGNVAEGLAIAQRLRDVAARVGAPSIKAWASYSEGEARMRDEPQRAMELFEEAIRDAESVEAHFITGVSQVSLTSLQARHGDARRALASFRELIDLWRRGGNWTQLLVMLRSVDEALVRLGSFEVGAALHTAITETDRSAPIYGDDAQRLAVISATLEAELAPDVLAAARARGRTVRGDDLVELVREEIDRVLARVPS